MKQIIEYTNDNIHIMPGFYESILFSSDTEYEENLNIEQDCKENGEEFVEHEIKDFAGFQKEVCSRIVDNLIKPMLCEDNEICDNIKLTDVYSPRQYNFTTDKIDCEINIDTENLQQRYSTIKNCMMVLINTSISIILTGQVFGPLYRTISKNTLIRWSISTL